MEVADFAACEGIDETGAERLEEGGKSRRRGTGDTPAAPAE